MTVKHVAMSGPRSSTDWTYRKAITPRRVALLGDRPHSGSAALYSTLVFHYGGPTGFPQLMIIDGNKNAHISMDAGTTWTSHPITTTATTPLCMVWDDTQYVVGWDDGSFTTSPDGVIWTEQTGMRGTWGGSEVVSLAWNGSILVAGGETGYIATSTDGITWTNRSGLRSTSWGTVDDVNVIIWDGVKFVAGGSSGKMATSTDGSTWVWNDTLRTSSWSTGNIHAMHWNGTQFLVYGKDGEVLTSTSTDLTTWSTPVTLGFSDSDWPRGNQLIYWDGANYFLINLAKDVDSFAGVDKTIAKSTDGGATWSESSLPDLFPGVFPPGESRKMFGIVRVGGVLTVLTGDGILVQSDNSGVTWYLNDILCPKQTSFTDSVPYTVNWNGTQFIIAGNRGSVATSPDGFNWTGQPGLRQVTDSDGYVNHIEWGNGLYVAVGGISITNTIGRIVTSPDGVYWTSRASLSQGSITRCNWNGSQYIAVGYTSGSVFISTDGITWTEQTGLAGTTWGTGYATDIVWNGSQYLIAGQSGKVATSTDGITWTYRGGLVTAWGTSAVGRVVWNGSQYLAITFTSDTPRIATSADGITWTRSLAAGTALDAIFSAGYPKDLIWDGYQYIVVGYANAGSTQFYHRIATSLNGVDWYQVDGAYYTDGARAVPGAIGVGAGKYVTALSTTLTDTKFSVSL